MLSGTFYENVLLSELDLSARVSDQDCSVATLLEDKPCYVLVKTRRGCVVNSLL